MHIRNHAFHDDQINPRINIKVSDVNQALKDYDKSKGWLRPMWDQADISKLRALHNQLSSVKEDRYLNASESYTLFSILLNSQTVQNSASSTVLQMLEDINSELTTLSRVLNKYHCFNESIFNVLYRRLEYIHSIKSHADSLESAAMVPIPEHLEIICRYAKANDGFLGDVVSQCKTVGMSNKFISDVIEKVLDKKLDSFTFWNKIRYADTVNYNELLNACQSDTPATKSGIIRVTQKC